MKNRRSLLRSSPPPNQQRARKRDQAEHPRLRHGDRMYAVAGEEPCLEDERIVDQEVVVGIHDAVVIEIAVAPLSSGTPAVHVSFRCGCRQAH